MKDLLIMTRLILIFNIIFLLGFVLFSKKSQNQNIIWVPASLTMFVTVIMLPVLIDANHRLSTRSILASITLFMLMLLLVNKDIRYKKNKLMIPAFFLILNLYILITYETFKRLVQLTPDTYAYIFIARSINSSEGLNDINQGTLLLRGLNLPILLAIFQESYTPYVLPSIIVILNFITVYGFCKEFEILKKPVNYLELIALSLIFITTLQGFYLLFYVTTHGIVSLSILLYFGTVIKYKLRSEDITSTDHLIKLVSLVTLALIRPEGIILSVLMILFSFQYLNQDYKYLRIHLYPILLLLTYWFFSLYSLEPTERTLFASYLFGCVFILSIIYVELFVKRKRNFAVKILNFILILLLFSSIIFTWKLLITNISACLKLSLLNEGGLGFVPILMLVTYFYVSIREKHSNKILMNLSLTGIALTYLIIPVLNGNQWICGSAGWGDTIARSYNHFIILFGFGFLVRKIIQMDSKLTFQKLS